MEKAKAKRKVTRLGETREYVSKKKKLAGLQEFLAKIAEDNPNVLRDYIKNNPDCLPSDVIETLDVPLDVCLTLRRAGAISTAELDMTIGELFKLLEEMCRDTQ